MKKGFVIAGIIGIVIGSIAAGAYLFVLKKGTDTTAQQGIVEPTKAIDVRLATWKDQAQFTFEYPETLKIDPHPEDQDNYAHVELTNPEHPGNVVVWAKDTTAADLTTWLKQNKIETAIDTNLGGEVAKKTMGEGKDKTILVTTIHGGYLYQVEVTLADSAYWQKTFDGVLASLTFTDSQETVSQVDTSAPVAEDSGGGGDEEVVE
jgi:hypothetical protein